MSLKAAFNMLLSMHSRPMTIKRLGTAYIGTIQAAPSNYFRNLEVAGSVIEEGREFVISKDALGVISYPLPKRGDRLLDSELGEMVISECREMFSIGAEIVGYRVRTN